MSEETASIIDNTSNWDASTIQEISFQICQKHQEEAKAFCTICNSLLCVFCMIKEDNEETDHNHKAVNAKTYCTQAKNKWKELQQKAIVLDQQYDLKIEELGNICSTMFKNISAGGPLAEEDKDSIEQQMDMNKIKLGVLKKFVKDLKTFVEKVEALETENRADLMTMFNIKLIEFQNKTETLEKVLSEMSIQTVIDNSFGDKSNREVEQNILTEENNQKSVNSYLIQKIHTLEDRINAKL